MANSKNLKEQSFYDCFTAKKLREYLGTGSEQSSERICSMKELARRTEALPPDKDGKSRRVPLSTISAYANGRVGKYDRDKLQSIADALGVSIYNLTGEQTARTTDLKTAAIVEYLGLSESTVASLRELPEDSKAFINALFDSGQYQTMISAVLIASEYFNDYNNAIECKEIPEISNDELTAFYKKLTKTGSTILPSIQAYEAMLDMSARTFRQIAEWYIIGLKDK